MIIGGAVREDRMFLTADSKAAAHAIQTAISGKNAHLSISPYGNQVEPYTETNTLVMHKHSNKPFTYEEVQTVLRKIEILQKISPETVLTILSQARKDLNAQLTFFYPNQRSPILEYCYSYNWAMLSFFVGDFPIIFPEIRDVLIATGDSSLRLFYDNSSVISVHNYTLSGLYIPRFAYKAISSALCSNGMLAPESVEDLTLRASAFGLRAVVLMECRQHSARHDEFFSLDSVKQEDKVGEPAFYSRLQTILRLLSVGVGFGGLSVEDRKLLIHMTQNADSLSVYKLNVHVQEILKRFLKEYEKEILTTPHKKPIADSSF